MNNILNSRAFSITALILSSIVLVLTLCGILGVWVTNYVASSLVIDISVAVENSAQALQRGVLRLDSGVDNLRGEIADVQQRVTQLSQNVSDEGLIRTLLPDSKVQRIDDATARVTDTTNAVRDSIDSARALYRSLNRIPGVNLPTLSEATQQDIGATMDEVRGGVNELKSGLAAVRERQANGIERVNQVTARIDTRLSNLQDRLNQINAALTNVQNIAKQLRQTIPMIFTILAVIATLILLWVIVSQVLVIRMMWHKIKNPPTELKPAEPMSIPPENTPPSLTESSGANL